MDFSQEQIKLIQEYAALFFSHKEIAFMIGIERSEINLFLEQANDIYSELGAEIYASRLKSEAEIRQRQVESAASGSSNAQTAVEKLISNLNFDNGTI